MPRLPDSACALAKLDAGHDRLPRISFVLRSDATLSGNGVLMSDQPSQADCISSTTFTNVTNKPGPGEGSFRGYQYIVRI